MCGIDRLLAATAIPATANISQRNDKVSGGFGHRLGELQFPRESLPGLAVRSIVIETKTAGFGASFP
jgi:hypothetical protein